MLDQLTQRIGSGHRVIVNLGDAGFIHRGRRIELARNDLAADAVGRLIDRDAAEVAEFLFQIPGAHQPAGAAANDCKIEHVCSVSLRQAFKAPGLNHPSKSAFHSEGKMNKAGPCIAAMQESSKKAGFRRPFFLTPYSSGCLIPRAAAPAVPPPERP